MNSIKITRATLNDQKVAIKSSLARMTVEDSLLRSLDHIGDAKWLRLIAGLKAFYLANPLILKASLTGSCTKAQADALLSEVRALIR